MIFHCARIITKKNIVCLHIDILLPSGQTLAGMYKNPTPWDGENYGKLPSPFELDLVFTVPPIVMDKWKAMYPTTIFDYIYIWDDGPS